MKQIFKLILATAVFSLSYGCADELLNNSGTSGTSQPTQFLTSDQLSFGGETNLDIPAAFVNGMYSQMVQTGTGGTNLSHDDFGHKGYDIYGDMLSGDMSLSVSTYGWYRSEISEFQAPLDFTRGRNRMVWRYYYRLIRSANNIIQNLGGNDAVPTVQENKFNMGQAKAMRAHSYFYLTQYYQKEYNASEAILPMPLAPIGSNLAKSTAGDIYTQMEKDLTEAISLLNGFTRTAKSAVNQDVAKGILAYVLGAKGGRDAEVATLTQEVINAGGYTMLAPSQLVAASGGVNGFDDVNSASWMWGVDLTETIGLGLVSWWGQVDAWSYSYAWAGDYKAIDKSLYDAIPANDFRKGQFFGNSASGRYLQPLYKFKASDNIGGASQTVTADYVYMRIEEMYLMNAEANARAGAEGAARISLKALMANRVPDNSYIDALSGQALLDEIYLQTRIEMWGEGKSFLAMKRNKATTSRGTNHLSFVGTAIPYNDERMQFEIPLDEIQNNPFISDQNQ
ncbi:RagB/SusD family nutrient uptake outer membrane protein [uncultured Tenacibaculum sp.]|uniref:RagB/SusD family nutrient uptake outer membrane protein n=1 Tax=uncultured Tenacibaculum sp. TaxID=174713 RepID=UPI00262B1019|nr:RagB/SusD family nutrient uptake outer membrane protein [uncultured Tenacibaculum sp.]